MDNNTFTNSDNLSENPLENKKLYSMAGIILASFLGSLVAAGVLLWQNYIQLNEEKKGLKVLLITIILTIGMFSLIFLIPEDIIDKIPNLLIPAFYTAILVPFVQKMQGDIFKNHTNFYSNWKAVGISLLVAAVMVIAMIKIFMWIILLDLPLLDLD